MNFLLEDKFDNFVMGIDEAGRGPLAGPVVAAGVLFLARKAEYITQIKDSKKISKKKREEIYQKLITDKEIIYEISVIDVELIDEINIFVATKLAMQNIYGKIKKKYQDIIVLVDGNHKMIIGDNKIIPVIKGDNISISIAAASIIAKVTRDNIMLNLDKKFPEYSWQSNSGYGTKKHLDAINKYGITKHHRKSYAPIKNIVNESKYKKNNTIF